jgi:hypothetical protein
MGSPTTMPKNPPAGDNRVAELSSPMPLSVVVVSSYALELALRAVFRLIARPAGL